MSVEQGSGNVFTDLGLPDAELLQEKLLLAVQLNDLLEARGLSHEQLATTLGIEQPDAAALEEFRLDRFSADQLRQFLSRPGY